MISLPLSILLITVSFAGAIVSGTFGMAGGVIMMGVLAWVLPVVQAIILHAIAQFFSNITRAAIHWQHIYFRGIFFYTIGLLISFGIFALISITTTQFTVFIMLGLLPFVTYLLPKKLGLNFSKPSHAFVCGILTNAFMLTAGVAGGIMDVFFQSKTMPRHTTVATKALAAAIGHATKFIYFMWIASSTTTGLNGLPLWLCLAVIPATFIGTHLSKNLLEKISDHNFYKATQILLFCLGAIYLYKAYLIWIN